MQSQRSCFRNLTPSFLILSLPDLRSSANATPRLSEDKVKQCVDPKLGAEYPPKAIAKYGCHFLVWIEHEFESESFILAVARKNGQGNSLIELAKKCVARDINSRPNISEVFMTLSKIQSSTLNWDPSDELERLAKRFLLQSLGKKWREHRIKLWNEFYDPRLSKTEIINNTPEDIALDQWTLFVEYRLKPETQNLCKRNQEIRQKQTIPHTSGAKSIARRRAELTEETGKEVSRVQMWDITHKKTDGSYVNEKAKEIAEKIEAYSSQQAVESTVNSPLDALGVVLGKEHPGRVRGLGMGAVPTVAFKNNTTRISQMNLGSSNDASTSSTCGSNVQKELDTVKAQLQALVSYIAFKEGGKIPVELARMFPTQQISQVQIQFMFLIPYSMCIVQ
ncbi:hypothetical protein AHAS_Ahas10G0063500 [Arachis hypogaea]